VGLLGVTGDGPAAARLDLPPRGHNAHVWVRDTGCGMDAATRERIFEPFFTTKPVGQGTGLGLSVVHGILAAHQGAIEVESEPGQGSCFHLYLPLAAVQRRSSAAGGGILPPPAGHGEHLIVIDDDETMLLMVTRLLERQGYRVTGFRDAQLALAAVREAPGAVDCVLTDFNMPGRSGLDLARELAQLRPGLPVVISSGYITDELSAQARQCGVRGLVEKQNSFEELPPLVARVLAQETVARP
jgi:CheY-like chemotaxis protein